VRWYHLPVPREKIIDEQNFYRVYAYIVRRVGDRHQAEDLTSAVFREALAGIGKFEWRGVPFAAWLVGIASRVVADYWKRLMEIAGPLRDLPDDHLRRASPVTLPHS
jgi:DNA-directed RNA polymerase specialized sigma24 family protein